MAIPVSVSLFTVRRVSHLMPFISPLIGHPPHSNPGFWMKEKVIFPSRKCLGAAFNCFLSEPCRKVSERRLLSFQRFHRSFAVIRCVQTTPGAVGTICGGQK